MVKQGDVLLFDSSVVTTKLVVNKVVRLSMNNNNHYAYIYTDFNQNIINELCDITGDITELTNKIGKINAEIHNIKTKDER